jgi:predicted CopG family antitoxin
MKKHFSKYRFCFFILHFDLAWALDDQRNNKAVDIKAWVCYNVTHKEVISMNQTLTIRIPDDIRQELQELSRDENKPVSDVVREALKRYLAIYRFRKLRNMVLPFAEAQGILSDEDIFSMIS